MKAIYILTLLLAFFTIPLYAETEERVLDERMIDLYFANGMMGKSIDKEKDTWEKYAKKIIKANPKLISKYNSKLINIKVAFNAHEEWGGDYSEVLLQKFGDIITWGKTLEELNKYVMDNYLIDAYNLIAQSLNPEDLYVQIQSYKQDITAGHHVIVVAHSQGNFFTTKSYEYLDEWMYPYFHMIGVASPSSVVLHDGLRVSFDNDPIPVISLTPWTIRNENRNRDVNGLDYPYTLAYHGFEYYMGEKVKVNDLGEDKNVSTVVAYNQINTEIVRLAEASKLAPSQWEKYKDIGCGCSKRVQFKQIGTGHIIDESTNTGVLSFKDDGKLYLLGTEWVKASPVGTGIQDKRSTSNEDGICYILEGTEEKIELTSSLGDLTKGAVEISLIWEDSSIDLDLKVDWPGYDNNISDTGCPMEYFLIESANDIYTGRYPVYLSLKEEPIEPIKDPFSQNVDIIINVLGTSKKLHLSAKSLDELRYKKVADIFVEYKEDETGKTILGIAVETPENNGFGIQNIFKPKNANNEELIRTLSCVDTQASMSCGCIPCYATIIPYLEQAVKGPLSGADVQLHIASKYQNNTPLYTTKTSIGETLVSAGIIDIPDDFTQLLEDEELYLIEVSGGLDVDSDDNYEKDSFETFNRGTLHSLILGKELKKIGYKLNILTEVSYQILKDKLDVQSPPKIVEQLNEIAQRLLKEKIYINSEKPLSYEDALIWLPTFDKGLLYLDYNTSYEPLVQDFYKDHDVYDQAYNIVYKVLIEPKLKASDFNVTENTEAPYILGSVEVFDEGNSSIKSFVLEGAGSENFVINNVGEVSIANGARLDYEQIQFYKLLVSARNDEAISKKVEVFIQINDEIDAPYFKEIEVQKTIFTDTPAGSFIRKITFEEGASSITQIELNGIGSEYFNVDINGNIVVANLGFETFDYKKTFELLARAYNVFGFSRVVELRIAVIGESVPTIEVQSMSIDENSTANSYVGTIKLLNPHISVDSFILNGEGKENYRIDTLGNIYLSDEVDIDYEKKTYYPLSVIAKTSTSQSEETNFTVYIKNSPDIPVMKSNQIFEVLENTKDGYYIGNILEFSGLSDITNFTLDAASIDIHKDNFRVDLNGNLWVNDGASFDYEQQIQYSFYCGASNSYGSSIKTRVLINILDTFDSPVLTPLVTNIDENSPVGSLVGKISYVLDEGSIIAFRLSGDGAQKFNVDLNGSIYLAEGASLDYEARSSYTIRASAENESGPSSEVNVFIQVNDLLDAPVLYDFTINIDENITNATWIGNILANEGLSTVLKIELRNETNQISNIFTADTLGNIYVSDNTAIDYEKQTLYRLKANAYNTQGVSLDAFITLYISNILDAPEIENFYGNINENSSLGTNIGKLILEEGLSPITSLYLDPSNVPFLIDTLGNISLKNNVDYEKNTNFTFKVYASNSQGESIGASVSIDINDVIDTPVLESLSFEVKEDVFNTETIGKISYIDGLDPITSIKLTGQGAELFRVSDTGFITLKEEAQLDFESQTEYNLQAQAFSLSGDSNLVGIHIVVADVDENAKAGIGLWGNAQVEIYKIEDNGTKTLKFTETTNAGGSYADIGRFYSHRLELEKDHFYLYKVSGGEEYDKNKDGIIDTSLTPNLGTLHAIVKGEWVRKLDTQMSINLMSDIFYLWLKDELDKNQMVSVEYSLKTTSNPISFLSGLQSLSYNPQTQLNQWHDWEFSSANLDYMANFMYEDNPKYLFYVNNSFYYDYVDHLDHNSVFIENGAYLYNSSDYYKGLQLFEIGKSSTTALASLIPLVTSIELSQDKSLLVVNQSLENEEYRVLLLNIQNPLAPIELSSLSEHITGMKLSPSANTLYVRDNNLLKFIDISNKNEPRVTNSTITTYGKIKDIVFSSNESLMYIADAKGGLQIVSTISNEIIGNYMTDGLIQKVLLSSDESKAIVSVNSDTNTSIHIIDIIDSTNPIVLNKLEIDTDGISTFSKSDNEIDFYIAEQNINVYENSNAEYSNLSLLSKIINYENIQDIYLLEDGLKILVITFYQALLFDVSDKAKPVLLEEIQLAPVPG